jgi:NAD(P)-dependent dehydrogenase (short-subunit alcohol dehydrogenase family)
MRIAVVTGANKGIGLELCRQLRLRQFAVLAACRRASPELRDLGCEIVEGVDVTDDASVARLAAALAGRTVEVLVNNAGILSEESLDDLDVGRMRRQFEVNAIGPLRVTHALLGKLGRGSKVVIVTSRMGSLGDNASGGYYGYRMSKAAVNIAGVSLARDLKSRGIAVLLLHPGMVATGMTGGRGIPVAEAAANLAARIEALGLDQTGTFRQATGEPLPW